MSSNELAASCAKVARSVWSTCRSQGLSEVWRSCKHCQSLFSTITGSKLGIFSVRTTRKLGWQLVVNLKLFILTYIKYLTDEIRLWSCLDDTKVNLTCKIKQKRYTELMERKKVGSKRTKKEFNIQIWVMILLILTVVCYWSVLSVLEYFVIYVYFMLCKHKDK